MKYFVIISLGLVLVFTHQSSQKHIAPRIVGGDTARAGQFPFAAAIYTHRPDSTNFCNGALLSTLWVLTAAHCIDGATLTTIQLGSDTLKDTDINRRTLSTDQLIIHPHYDPLTYENDIGLIMFRMEIQFTDYIQPITFFPIAELPGTSTVTALGWGQASDEIAGVSNSLRFVKLATLTNDECKAVYGNQIKDSMVCVSGNYKEGICNGDSGSPLIQNIANGHTLIVGVASFMSRQGCENTDPSGYTRVFPYKSWITDVTGVQ